MFCLRSMLAIANIVLPVFALIIAGYVLRRRNVLSTNACTELNRFVVYLALPALMIDVMVNSTWSELYQPEFFYAFELGVFIIFFAVLAFHWLKTKNLTSATIDATSASYANTGYIGLPLCALTFGADKLGPAMVAAILTVSANFAVSIVFIEASSQSGKSVWTTLKKPVDRRPGHCRCLLCDRTATATRRASVDQAPGRGRQPVRAGCHRPVPRPEAGKFQFRRRHRTRYPETDRPAADRLVFRVPCLQYATALGQVRRHPLGTPDRNRALHAGRTLRQGRGYRIPNHIPDNRAGYHDLIRLADHPLTS